MKGKVAIIGMASCYAQSPDHQSLWKNLIKGTTCISEFPFYQRWGEDLHIPGTPPSLFSTYADKAGVINYDLNFDPLEHYTIPFECAETDPDHLLLLKLTKEALVNAGISRDEKSRKSGLNCGVILGKSAHVGPAALELIDLVRFLPQLKSIIQNGGEKHSQEVLEEVTAVYRAERNNFNNSKGISLLSNIASGRIANKLNLRGPSYVVDAACASSLIAIENSVKELLYGNVDLMVAGGAYLPVLKAHWMGFSFLGALSATGAVKPFDKSADGTLLGEGAGVVVLKRLEDAVRENTPVLAVIESISSNSNGLDSSLLATSSKNQLSLYEQTWRKVDLDPRQVSFIECHGTGMPAGDRSEIQSLTGFFGGNNTGKIPVGSVKSQVGHTLGAAGMAGLIKTIYALNEKLFPPTLNCADPIEELKDSPFFINQQTIPAGHPKVNYACINSFGFGGINSHLIISAPPENSKHRYQPQVSATGKKQPDAPLFLATDTAEELLENLRSRKFNSVPNGRVRLVLSDMSEETFKKAERIIQKGVPWRGKDGIYFSPDALLARPNSKLAVLFPGVSSTYNREYTMLARKYQVDISQWNDYLQKESLSSFEENAIHAVVSSLVNFQILEKEGIHSDGIAGYSLGEYSALIAGGIVDEQGLQLVIRDIFKDDIYNQNAFEDPDSALIAVSAGKTAVEPLIADLDKVYIAIDNSTNNVIVSVSAAMKDLLMKRLIKQKIIALDIGVNTRNHTPVNTKLISSVKPIIDRLEISPVNRETWSSVTALPFPQTSSSVRDIVYKNFISQIRFRDLIENMYNSGYRVFIQLGFGGIAGYVSDTLRGKEHLSLNIASRNVSSSAAVQNVLYSLYAEGIRFPSAGNTNTEVKGNKRSEKGFLINSGFTERSATRVSLKGPADGIPDILPAGSYNDINVSFIREAMLANSKMLYNAQKAVYDILKSGNLHQRPADDKRAGTGTTVYTTRKNNPSLEVIEEMAEVSLDTYPDFSDHEIYLHSEEIPAEHRSSVVPMSAMVQICCIKLLNRKQGFEIRTVSTIEASNFIFTSDNLTLKITYREVLPRIYTVTMGDNFKCKIEITEAGQCGEGLDRFYAKEGLTNEVKEASYLYDQRVLFSGKKYQGLKKLAGFSKERAVVYIQFPGGYSSLLDNCFQALAYWHDSNNEIHSLILPFRIEQMEFYIRSGLFFRETFTGIYTEVIVKQETEQFLKADFNIYYEERQIAKIGGFIGRKFESNPLLEKLFRFPYLPDAVMAQPICGNVFLYEMDVSSNATDRLLYYTYLDTEEKNRYMKIKNIQEKKAFLLGRVALKDAIKYRFLKPGDRLFHTDISVTYKNAAPYVNVPRIGISNLPVSVAHKPGIGVACVESSGPAGVDVEYISAMGTINLSLAFNEAEMEIIESFAEPDIITCVLWTAKEAYFKYAQQDEKLEAPLTLKSVRITDVAAAMNTATENTPAKLIYQGKIEGGASFSSFLYKDKSVITFINTK